MHCCAPVPSTVRGGGRWRIHDPVFSRATGGRSKMMVRAFEEHASVLAEWWSLPRRPRTLVYLDAHLDLQQLSPKRLRQLEECTTVQQVAELNKPHHLFPDHG